MKILVIVIRVPAMGKTPNILSQSELQHYARHLSLSQVGLEGQEKLKQAKVLIIGAGGLSSPAALYLVAAGVGTIGLVDFDRVEASNLQRQILHGYSSEGRFKTESAKSRLADLNPHVHLEMIPEKLEASNCQEIFAPYDIIVDGTDNFSTRYLVNDACALFDKVLVSAAIHGFQGQVMVLNEAGGPCYRCLYPKPPGQGAVPSCAEGGVLGVLPGIIGSIQAAETLKLILSIGKPLSQKLLLFDALEMTSKTLKIPKDPACAVCGETPSIKTLVDSQPAADCASFLPELTPGELREKNESTLLVDIRTDWERELSSIPNSVHVPSEELISCARSWSKEEPVVLYCKSGKRSLLAGIELRNMGFENVSHLAGGIDAWERSP